MLWNVSGCEEINFILPLTVNNPIKVQLRSVSFNIGPIEFIAKFVCECKVRRKGNATTTKTIETCNETGRAKILIPILDLNCYYF